MTTDTLTFEPTTAAYHAYDQFHPAGAGTEARTTAHVAASVVLFKDVHENKALRALIVHYGQRRDELAYAAPARHLNEQLWMDGIRQSNIDRYRELLCCIMVALLIPADINPNKIAPADYGPIADIALANIRYGDTQ